jgi:hypothetical protein
MDETLVTLAMFADTFQAELAKAKLEAEGIAAVVDEDATYQLYGYATGGVRLEVKGSDKERARQLLGLTERASKAEVVSCSTEGDVTRTVLRFDILPTELIVPASLYSEAEDSDDEFDLHKVLDVAASVVTFETYDAGDTHPEIGVNYVFRAWWEPEQLELVRDESIIWRREAFAPSDAVRDSDGALRKFEEGPVEDNEEIVVGGWEHEHCRLCWQTISAYQGQDNFGYTDGTDWMCEPCYQRYIASGLRKKLG